jgi:4-hydroxy-tetrahydrodipicolinate reductase
MNAAAHRRGRRSGRMGRMLIEAVLASGDLQLSGALDMPGSPALGQDAGAFLGRNTGVASPADLRAGLAGAEVLIDFTRPEGTLAHLACAASSASRW